MNKATPLLCLLVIKGEFAYGIRHCLWVCIWGLASSNYAAGDLGSCVAGRLCTKIIRIAVDDHRSTKDILNPETICAHCHAGASLI